MAAIDVFCAPDDRHRVILLVNLLERAGCDVTLHSEPVSHPTDPCLVAVTRRALREPWMETLFAEVRNLAAMRLDDSLLPWPCSRVIDLQAWPARSADRKVLSLVQWLQLRWQRPSSAGGTVETAGVVDEPSTPRSGTSAGSLRRPRARRARAGDRHGNAWGGLLVLALLTGTAYALFALMPERRPGGPENAAEPAGRAGVAVDAVGVLEPVTSPAGGVGLAGDSAAADRAARSPATAAAAPVPEETSDVDTQMPPRSESADLDALPPRRRSHRDALSHLCDARSVGAARAWAGALDWKQRRRLPAEPCVQALLERPGFEDLTGRL